MDQERSLEQRLAELEALVRTLVVRVTELELGEPSPPPSPEAQPTPTAAPRPIPGPIAGAEPAEARPAAGPSPGATPPRTVTRPGETLEDLLGGRILASVG